VAFPQTALQVTEWGACSPALLVHGSLTGDPADDDWAEQRPLAERYHLLLPARRGYAGSPARPPGFTAIVEADELAALLGDGAHLVGFSYGGFLALLMAAARPEAVGSLTLIEPSALSIGRGNPDLEALIARMRPVRVLALDGDPEAYLLAFRRALRGLPPDAPLALSDEDRQQMGGVRAAMGEQPQWEVEIPLDALAAHHISTLIFTGGWSRALDAVADTLAKRLGAQRVVIPGAGHGVQHVGAPFNQHVQAFWEAVERSV
jgi:pimeloyl-ACP methyl ester carboxylesterase